MDLYQMCSTVNHKILNFQMVLPAVTTIPNADPDLSYHGAFQSPTRFSGYIRFSKGRLHYLDGCPHLN